MSETLIVQSNESGLREVEEFLDRSFDTYHVAHYAATMTVPVLQAVQNAIQHGNASDSAKRVRLEVGHCTGGVYFEVEDEGNGFDYEGTLARAGREGQGSGLFLIASLADHFSYSKGGRLLRMEFDVDGVMANDAFDRVACLQHFYQVDAVEVDRVGVLPEPNTPFSLR